MIRQPERGTRNVNDYFYEYEGKYIAELNRVLEDIELTRSEEQILIWLAGWDESTVKGMLSVMEKLKEKGRSQSRESIADRLQKHKDGREDRGGYAPNKKTRAASRNMER